MYLEGLWLPLLSHVSCQGSGGKPAVIGLTQLSCNLKGQSHSHHTPSNSTESVSRQWASRSENLPQDTHLPAMKQKGFSSSPTCGVCTQDLHPPLSSGQGASRLVQIVAKFSWRLPSSCGDFPMATLPKDACDARKEWLAWRPSKLPGPFPLLSLPLSFTHLSKLTQLPVRLETSPAN